MTKRMHLGVVLVNGPTQHIVGEWSLPRQITGHDWRSPAFWEDIARTLERGKFDMVFLGDTMAANDNYAGSPDAAIKYSLQFPAHDPMPLLPYMAAVTSRIGLVATASTTYTHPYTTARTFATLANLTSGRVGWNAVASSHRAESENFGRDSVMPSAERYDRADEYVEVCKKLWESWDRGAMVLDKEERIWGDPTKIRPINHEGRFFKSKGPLNVSPAPEGSPVIAGAGQSDRGLEFCARHSEVVFAIQFTGDAMRRQREKFREKLVAQGRDPNSVSILWGVLPIIGETSEAAHAKEQMIFNSVPAEGGLAFMSAHFGIDGSIFELDDPLESAGTDTGSRGLLDTLAKNYGRAVTVGEAGKLYGCGISPHVVGTAEQVADQLEHLYDEAGGDGFLLMTHYLPGSLHEFVELVIPVLQDRGRFRQEYKGSTLREHLSDD
ncbi:NtaA/DmoA family FMN-dependent monooxygenase (plasmid) [Streptomyces sp. NBC_00289]|uniref:NtaA/DmoA family FMN-dependent monooxygenase n=1 Tax=Streptomyces sp. NBC_00289 TaxID=2975703 RepID=UPI0032487847